MEMSNNKLSDSLMDEDFKRDSELYKIGSTVCAMFNLIDGGHIDGSTFECIQNKDQVLLLRSALTNYSTKNGLPCIAVNTPGCYGCAIRSSHIKRCTNTDITQEKSRCTMGSNQGEIAENENRKYGTVIRYSISSFDNVHNESISNSISDERLELTPKSLSPMHTRAANSQTGALEQGASN